MNAIPHTATIVSPTATQQRECFGLFRLILRGGTDKGLISIDFFPLLILKFK